MTSIPADRVNNGCVITVDQLNPSIVVAVLTWMPNGATRPSTYDNYVTFDGGASWRKLTASQPLIMSLLTGPATRNGTTYATRDVLTGNAYHNGLWVSSDHMTTWRLIDPPGVTADAATFTLQPTTGEIFAQYGEPEQPSDLWDSLDGGAHWTQINAPTLMTPSPSRYPYITGQSGSRSGWMICSTVAKVAGAATGDSLTCSKDGGKTWDTLPTIIPDTPSANPSQQVAIVSGIASDGTIVAILTTGSANELYRFAPGAVQWQSLGDLPSAMNYSFLSGDDVIWSVQSPLSPIIATTHR
ncbi:MAG TPA: hypothetical protein VFN78_11720 [Ktedonobacterales bacterium]|nr:hypothetical protein [Ktedonobacterales bacterium]